MKPNPMRPLRDNRRLAFVAFLPVVSLGLHVVWPASASSLQLVTENWGTANALRFAYQGTAPTIGMAATVYVGWANTAHNNGQRCTATGARVNLIPVARLPRPPLSLTLTGNSVTLSWPLANDGFTLQSRTNLILGGWENVTAPAPQILDDQWQVPLPPSTNHSAFYRLMK